MLRSCGKIGVAAEEDFLDAAADPLHGNLKGCFFHGRCYLPLYVRRPGIALAVTVGAEEEELARIVERGIGRKL